MARRTLPVIPLQDVVLFPGMLLPLHIFEPRYVGMVKHCLGADERFGTTLLPTGGGSGPCDVGTVALIEEARPIEGGRYLLMTIGEERFRMVRTWSVDDLLWAEVDTFGDQPGTAAGLEALCDDVREQATEQVRLVVQALGREYTPPTFPDSPVELSFLLAASLQADAGVRQELLVLTDTADRLRRLGLLLKQQVETVGYRLQMHEQVQKLSSGNGRLGHHHLTQDGLDKLHG